MTRALGPDSVGDPGTMRSRLLSERCRTCIYRPGNPMFLNPGALKDITGRALAGGRYVVCHATLAGVAPPGVEPAICRGFWDRYRHRSQGLVLIAAMFGFLLVDPPGEPLP